jgi:galactose-1-phosphate uridylyltransferase
MNCLCVKEAFSISGSLTHPALAGRRLLPLLLLRWGLQHSIMSVSQTVVVVGGPDNQNAQGKL